MILVCTLCCTFFHFLIHHNRGHCCKLFYCSIHYRPILMNFRCCKLANLPNQKSSSCADKATMVAGLCTISCISEPCEKVRMRAWMGRCLSHSITSLDTSFRVVWLTCVESVSRRGDWKALSPAESVLPAHLPRDPDWQARHDTWVTVVERRWAAELVARSDGHDDVWVRRVDLPHRDQSSFTTCQ